jgi:hypothetical protein
MASSLQRVSPLVYIYIKKVCLFVRYAFSPCNSYRHQTFHDTSLGPREGQRRVDMVIGGGGVGEID